MRSLLLALALLSSGVATAQAKFVVVSTTANGGYSIEAASDEPVGDTSSALLTQFEGGWLLRSLSAGDVPSEVAAQSTRNVSRIREQGARVREQGALVQEQSARVREQAARVREQSARLRGEAVRVQTHVTPRAMRLAPSRVPHTASSRVRYTVWFSRLPATAVPALLADLEAEAPFTEAEVQSSDETAEVQLSFSFSSVEAWTEWTEQTDLEERFAQDPSVRVRTTVNVSRSVRRVLEDMMDRMDIGDGEIIDDTFEGDVIGDGEIIDDID